MGLRFRKSINLGGGAKINISKSGIGYSFGTKGARVTKKSSGGTRRTLSVPGTGISYVKDTGNSRKTTTRSKSNTTRGGNMSNSQGPKKRKTWLWVLGWLFIFPLPLTILLLRKKEMKAPIKYGIIAAAWIIYLIIAIAAGGSGSGTNNTDPSNRGTQGSESAQPSSTESQTSTDASKEKINVTALAFSDTSDVTVKVGQKSKTGTVKVTLKSSLSYSSDDVQFVSENPEIATITFVKHTYGKTVYYEIEGISPGETYVYGTSKDGSISTEKIKVIVPVPIEVESVTLSTTTANLAIGETLQITATIAPDNADNIELSWTSGDESIVTVDQKGNVVAVSGGTTTVTATASNGVSASADITVDPSRRLMSLRVTHPRDDDINIGDEWSYITEINGERTGREFAVAAGETLTFHAKFTESDDNPDVGEASKQYTVTEEDLLNGFTVTMDLYVTENGGRNSGKSAHFVVTFTFTAK